ncbi:MAG: SDR family NAD(P)-dependent oxidoreductase [bacterium]|nr:SDR family NAD(P)-dependent oxidoreductase [bacterium]
MPRHLDQRTALVTGAASGIGRACAARLAAEGLRVAAADVQADPLEQLAEDVASVHVLDVTDYGAVQATVAEIGHVDVVVNCAGIIGPQLPIWEVPLEGWERTLAVNLTGTFNTIKATMGAMRARGWGRIVNIASIAGKEGNPNMVAYSASKAAVIGLTKSVGKEACTDGVLVNAVAPAVISTPMNADTEPDMMEYMLSKIPMRRLGLPDEVAELVSWLASDACAFSTGAVYDISGGRATY